jgi:hypothetical protein
MKYVILAKVNSWDSLIVFFLLQISTAFSVWISLASVSVTKLFVSTRVPCIGKVVAAY